MANWKEKAEKIRHWIDNESEDKIPSGIEKAQNMKSESEKFLQKLINAVEELLEKEITRFEDINKAYIPEKFVVYLSSETDKSLRLDKKKYFEQGLSARIFKLAKEKSGELELTSKKIIVEIAVDGTLEEDEVEVRAFSFDKEKTIEILRFSSDLQNLKNNKTIEPIGTIEDFDTERIEIWKLGKKINEFPIIQKNSTIGREGGDKTPDLRLVTDNRKISSEHAKIEIGEDKEIWITALHKNPTIVSGQTIRNGERAKLGSDGEIQIYDFTLKITQL